MGADGDRISRGTLQYRVLRAVRRAGIDADRARGALVHGLRHTFANADVSVYTLMNLNIEKSCAARIFTHSSDYDISPRTAVSRNVSP